MTRKKPQSAMAALLDFTVGPTEEYGIPPTENAWHDDGQSSTGTESASSNTMQAYTKAYAEPMVSHVQTTLADNPNELITLNPNDCIVWRFSDRPADELGDIDSLARSMKEHGQQEPILVRENRQNTEHSHEIIFGNRRWRAAQIAKIPLIAICKNFCDKQAAIYQKEENENRKELSDYARAMSYRSQIDGGVFKNEAELSKVLGISKQALNDLMAYLRVPEALREAISNYKTLSKKMVTKLAALSKDEEMLDVLMHLAPKISDQTVTTATIEKHIQSFLMPTQKKNKWLQPTYEKKEKSGRVIYKTKLLENGEIAVTIHRNVIHTTAIEALHEKFFGFLEEFVN